MGKKVDKCLSKYIEGYGIKIDLVLILNNVKANIILHIHVHKHKDKKVSGKEVKKIRKNLNETLKFVAKLKDRFTATVNGRVSMGMEFSIY